MESGRMVILLNLENLYESLYDVLNQVINGTIINFIVDLCCSITSKVEVIDMLI